MQNDEHFCTDFAKSDRMRWPWYFASNAHKQWRKPGPQFGGDEKKFCRPPNSKIWGDGEKLSVSWN